VREILVDSLQKRKLKTKKTQSKHKEQKEKKKREKRGATERRFGTGGSLCER